MATKQYVVVSGASGTLGTAVCETLIAHGFHPVVMARNNEALETLAQGHAGNMTTYACDVSNATAVAQLFQQPFWQNDGMLCGVVACAGILQMDATDRFADADWDATIQTNLSGTFYLFKYAIPLMRKNGGSLIAIGSRWADGAATAAAYAASKAGLRGLIAAMQKEWAGSTIRPVLISPGSIASPMSSSVNDSTGGLDVLKPEDVADTILHVLMSPQRVIFGEIKLLAYNYDLADRHAT